MKSHVRPFIGARLNSFRRLGLTSNRSATPTSSASTPTTSADNSRGSSPSRFSTLAKRFMSHGTEAASDVVPEDKSVVLSDQNCIKLPSTVDSVTTRQMEGTLGLLPSNPENPDHQLKRILSTLEHDCASDLDRYKVLSTLRVHDVHLFYRVLSDVSKITPLVYTPTVGEACLKWSRMLVLPEGLYLSYFTDKGRIYEILKNINKDIKITVLTDGSRILGLGDLGINGMGIPIGKLALYTACAGIHPDSTLPLTIDFGTDNEEYLKAESEYLGVKQPKISMEEQMEFLDELMAAFVQRWPNIVIQYEDFKNPFNSLNKYKNTYCMFNDDVQGTGAVAAGGIIKAVQASGIAPKDHRVVFLGAGSAGVGVAGEIVNYFVKAGIPEEEAKKMFWLVDTEGLVTTTRGGRPLKPHKVPFARTDYAGRELNTLEKVIKEVKPTMLFGLSTTKGAFTEQILQDMATYSDRPIIFPLSNPLTKAECTFQQALDNTDGRCLFASGSPFDPVDFVDSAEKERAAKEGREPVSKRLYASQGNNMYVFPGIGLGAIVGDVENISDEMIYASALAVADSVTEEELNQGRLYPNLDRIRQVSVKVAARVIRTAQAEGKVKNSAILQFNKDKEGEEQLEQYIESQMYDPSKVLEKSIPETIAEVDEEEPKPIRARI